MKPDFKNDIITLINGANESICIANSWLTDSELIELILIKAEKIKIKIILSRDILNAYRYKDIITMQKNKIDIRIFGADSVGDANFMHAKFLIVDDINAYGGSYNFTETANSNFECFYRYHNSEVRNIKDYFDSMYKESDLYEFNLEEIINQANLKEQKNKSFNQRLLDSFQLETKSMLNKRKSYSIMDFKYLNGYFINAEGYKLNKFYWFTLNEIHKLNLKYVIWSPVEGSEWCIAELVSSIDDYERAKNEAT
jgi:phosphatidylserine/phosphatidylglycerophosphate/cardiolipin synthase-like enzyme